jgi:large subunit ribosomal protein L3
MSGFCPTFLFSHKIIMKFLLGKKIGMDQKFRGDELLSVTLIKAGPCTVTKITSNKDNAQAIQLGFQALKPAKVKKSQKNIPFAFVKQFKISDVSNYKVGDQMDVSIFQPGEKINLSSISKGLGFTGVMKRHGFHGMPATHGTKHDHRHGGSIGSTNNQRVVKGKKMAGRSGGQRTTIKNLEVIDIDKEKNILVVKGSIAGAKNSFLEITAK